MQEVVDLCSIEMTSFARINDENIVTYVTPFPSHLIKDNKGVIREEWAWGFLYNDIPESKGDRWLRTCRECSLRKNFAGIGYTYDENLDAFIPPKPYPSWTLNTTTCNWDPPVPEPELTEEDKTNHYLYIWDEENQSWNYVNIRELV